MKSAQKGFAVIEGILILAIIAIIGGTGYYVLHSKDQTEKTLSSAQSESTITSPVQKSGNTNSQKYLDIKELGIKLPVSGDISDLGYYWDGYYNANLYSNNLGQYIKQKDSSCVPDQTTNTIAGKLGSMFATNTVKPSGTAAMQAVGGKDVYYAELPQSCNSADKGAASANAQVSAVQADIITALHNAQPD